MTDQPAELDPDQVECDTCPANVGQVCLTPTGAKSRTVHMTRRRAAADGRVRRRNRPQPAAKRGSSPSTPAGRSKGGQRTAQARALRKKEAAAAAAAKVEELEQLAIAEHAERLAADTVRYTRDRLLVRRSVLDAAQAAHERLLESLAHLHRPKAYDDDGVPVTKPVERFHIKNGKRAPLFDTDGERVVEQQPDLVGYWTVAQVESLAKAAQQTLNSLRLEEGKPTGIFEQQGSGGAAETLGETGVRELLELADKLLPKGDQGSEGT